LVVLKNAGFCSEPFCVQSLEHHVANEKTLVDERENTYSNTITSFFMKIYLQTGHALKAQTTETSKFAIFKASS
jgi:hypothetical protein